MPIQGEELHVVRSAWKQTMASKNLQEFGAESSVGVRRSKDTVTQLAGYCDIEHSKVSQDVNGRINHNQTQESISWHEKIFLILVLWAALTFGVVPRTEIYS